MAEGVERIQIDSTTYRYEDGMVRFFLLIGSKKALLIDSGMTVRNAKELAKEVTDLPIELINTHADMDHVGSNESFEWFYLNGAEATNYYKGQDRKAKMVSVDHGDIIDLGDRPIQVIALPGHTPGSIALLDVNHRRLFSGDPIQDGTIYMFGEKREMHAYIESLKKMEKYKDCFDEIWPSHGTVPLTYDIVPRLLQAAIDMENGKYEYKTQDMFGNQVKVIDVGVATFLHD